MLLNKLSYIKSVLYLSFNFWFTFLLIFYPITRSRTANERQSSIFVMLASTLSLFHQSLVALAVQLFILGYLDQMRENQSRWLRCVLDMSRDCQLKRLIAIHECSAEELIWEPEIRNTVYLTLAYDIFA